MSDKHYVLFAATYSSLADAEADLTEVRHLQKVFDTRKVSAAVVAKDDDGRIHVHQTTETGKAAATGVVVGAIVGAIFPPAGLAVVGGAAAGAAVLGVVSGVIGHFSGGISRKGLKEAGAMLDEGEAALIAVGIAEVSPELEKAVARADRSVQHALDEGDVLAALAHAEAALAEVGVEPE